MQYNFVLHVFIKKGFSPFYKGLPPLYNVCHPEMFTPQRRFYSCLKMTFAKVITAPIRAGKWMEAAHQVNTFLKGKNPNVLVINKTVSCLNNLIFQLLWTGEFGMIMLISESAA